MTQKEEQWNRRGTALFRVRRSIRYHRYRQRYFESCHRFVMLVPILLSLTTVLILAVSTNPQSKVWVLAVLPFIAGVLTALDAVIGLIQHAGTHKDLIRQFTDVEQRLLGLDWQDPKALTAIDQTIVEIEKSEPVRHYRTLNLICRNEELEAEGRPKSELVEIRPVRRFFAQVSSR